MKTMDIVLLVLGVVILILLFLFLAAIIAHHKLFGKRFTSDERITFYTKEEFGLDLEEVKVPVGKVSLSGGIYSYKGAREDALVIYCHGMWSGVAAYMQDIECICKNGYKVMAMNHEGTDGSEGRNIRGLANSLRCLNEEINFIRKQEKYKNVSLYVAGHSWGAFAAVNIAYYHPEIKGILAISPFISEAGCLKGILKKPLWIIIPFFRLYDALKCGNYACRNALKSLEGFMGNIVIIHSENDNMVKFRYNTEALMKKNLKAHFMIYKDKKHNPNYTYEALDAAVAYVKSMALLKDEREIAEFMKHTDFHKIGELDMNVMNEALEYLFKEE